MRDEIDDRLWVEHGAALVAAIRDLIEQTRFAFVRLNARTWAAPWRTGEGHPCRDM